MKKNYLSCSCDCKAQRTTFSELQKQLGNFVRVTDKGARYACIEFEHGQVFQSYNSIVGVRIGCKYYFGALHDYSNTTNRQMINWCGMTAQERRNALQSGIAVSFE